MKSFSLRLNSYPKMGTYVAVLGWLANIKNHIKNYMQIYFIVTIDFPFLRYAFFGGRILASCFCHNLEKSSAAGLTMVCPCESSMVWSSVSVLSICQVDLVMRKQLHRIALRSIILYLLAFK